MDDTSSPPRRTGETATGNPRLFARVPQALYDRVAALRTHTEYRDSDGGEAPLSTVVRAFLIEGGVLVDPARRAAVDALCVARGYATRTEAWEAVVDAGLAALRVCK